MDPLSWLRRRWHLGLFTIHTNPFAIAQMDVFRAATPEAVRFNNTAMKYFTAYMAMAVREFLHFMPDQREGMPESVVKCVSVWEDVLTNWENPEWHKDPE